MAQHYMPGTVWLLQPERRPDSFPAAATPAGCITLRRRKANRSILHATLTNVKFYRQFAVAIRL
jgi:hypothetical protein